MLMRMFSQTSITIPEVVCVFDSGKVKEVSYDVDAGLSKLTETWVSRAAARQRRGRAGRTQPGECYKLYTLAQEETMLNSSIPEILRVPLDALSLQVKAATEDEDVAVCSFSSSVAEFLNLVADDSAFFTKSFLGKTIAPPESTAMAAAWKTLEDLGAVDEAGKLTALGKHMVSTMQRSGDIPQTSDCGCFIQALVPLDLRLAKVRDKLASLRVRLLLRNSPIRYSSWLPSLNVWIPY